MSDQPEPQSIEDEVADSTLMDDNLANLTFAEEDQNGSSAVDDTPDASPETPPSVQTRADHPDSTSPRQAQRAATRATKQALIAQAELVAMLSDSKTAPAEMKALLEQWRRAGRTTKAEDDALWVRFNLAQDQLFSRLDLLRQRRQSQMAEAKHDKLSLITTAEQVATRSDLRQAADTMAQLMAQWKAIGPAPDDKSLWLRFKAAQDQVYSRLGEERRQSHDSQIEAANTKRQIITQAQGLIGSADLRQAIEDLKQLDTRFREAGYAGRQANRSLADEFREARQQFYAWMRKEPVRRRETGQQGAYGRRARLVQQIEQTRRDITAAEDQLKSVDPSGGKRPHGRGITVTLGQAGAYGAAATDAVRLKVRLSDLESQLAAVDASLSAESTSRSNTESA
ncbi:MAG: DUF349 domain-containing protein [Propionibacteriaceae bacterium]|jgi:hypothetical protein|nr:DUF349 domain-containing protein [Propionibacteriaceae bacterium]